jgi:ribonuclease T2
VQEAEPAERWVEIDCGALVSDPVMADPSPASMAPPDTDKGPAGAFVLAASWHHAFCEVNPDQTDCRFAREKGDIGNVFSLHGLWPQPRDKVFCGVPARQRELSERGLWRHLPVLDLTDATRSRLDRNMPGTVSYLHRHEWIKHGTCYGANEDAYFRHSLSLLDQLNASPVRALFAEHVGRHLSSRRIRDAFSQAFGRGAGERVRVSCEDGIITELQIGLAGRIGEDSPLPVLMRAAKGRSVGCRGGRIDSAGVEN